VYLGRSKDGSRDVAIKAMYPEKMKQKQALQEREIEVMRSLRHRNVVELLDVVMRPAGDKSAGRAPYMFLIFEYAAGGDFAAYLKVGGGKESVLLCSPSDSGAC
jgi:serine/threonine protein kinase